MGDMQKNTAVNEGTVGQEFTVRFSNSNPTAIENLGNVRKDAWKDAALKELIGKWVILLTLSKIRFRTQF